MMACTRGPAPGALQEGAARWTAAWLQRRNVQRGAEFAWPKVRKVPLNFILHQHLAAMTRDHCAYCDGYPFGEMAVSTIDHFQPKSTFPELAFAWENLFLACGHCQSRQTRPSCWDPLTLKPDAPDYAFERFFSYDVRSGRIEPNPQASDEDRTRALATIELFGLNAGARPRARMRARETCGPYHPDDRPYRFLFAESPAPDPDPST